MWHQRKPDQVLELHDAHQLQLRPPPDQVINPLVHLRPGAGAAAEVEAGWAAGRSGRGAAVAGGVPLPPMGAGQAGANGEPGCAETGRLLPCEAGICA